MTDLVHDLPDIDWSFIDARTDAHIHGLHPYPARFIPQIPATLIEYLSRRGETVMDPFCGGGTTLVEASLIGRNAIGNDLNPVGALIAKVKTTPLTPTQLDDLDSCIASIASLEGVPGSQYPLFSSHDIVATAAAMTDLTPIIPDIPHVDHWFETSVQKDLAILTARIAHMKDGDVRDICRLALSAIMLAVSNQDSETRYVRRLKGIKPGETLTRFTRKLVDMRARIDVYSDLRRAAVPVTVRVTCGDTRELSEIDPGSVHLVVTSPPYPNAFDYHLYHRFRLFWLGHDPVAMARKEIGSHLNYQRNGENMDGFIRDMDACFVRINQALAMGRHCCVVIGDSVFKGEVVENDAIIARIAEGRGFVHEETITRDVHRVKRSFSSPARRLKEENIVILRKVGSDV